MKKLHWLFMMMCLAVLPALQSCDDLDSGYSIGDFSYPNWATIRVKGNAFYMESDTWGTLWPINTDMGWYQPVDGQRVVTVFNPIYDNYEGYDHAVKILRLEHALTKVVEPLTAENEEEYGNEKVDFSDLSSIDVAYTTTDDELYDVQTKINLENFSINYFLDGNIIKTKGYGSLQELCVLALSCLSFDWLIEPAIDYWYDECVKGDM